MKINFIAFGMLFVFLSNLFIGVFSDYFLKFINIVLIVFVLISYCHTTYGGYFIKEKKK